MADRYKEAGIDYGVLDAAKRLALSQAIATSPQLEARGGRAHDDSRGQSAFTFEVGGQTLALVVEGLGTKAMLARQYMDATGKDFFGAMAYDTVAAIVNDLCSVGALPLVVNAYFSTGDAAWLEGGPQFESLVKGWRQACEDAGATWGGGESPALPGLVSPTDVELAGSAVGVVPREPLLGGRARAGRRDRPGRLVRPARQRRVAGAHAGRPPRRRRRTCGCPTARRSSRRC